MQLGLKIHLMIILNIPEMAGTSTLPTAGAQSLPVTAQPQTQTSSDAQLQALGVIS